MAKRTPLSRSLRRKNEYRLWQRRYRRNPWRTVETLPAVFWAYPYFEPAKGYRLGHRLLKWLIREPKHWQTDLEKQMRRLLGERAEPARRLELAFADYFARRVRPRVGSRHAKRRGRPWFELARTPKPAQAAIRFGLEIEPFDTYSPELRTVPTHDRARVLEFLISLSELLHVLAEAKLIMPAQPLSLHLNVGWPVSAMAGQVYRYGSKSRRDRRRRGFVYALEDAARRYLTLLLLPLLSPNRLAHVTGGVFPARLGFKSAFPFGQRLHLPYLEISSLFDAEYFEFLLRELERLAGDPSPERFESRLEKLETIYTQLRIPALLGRGGQFSFKLSACRRYLNRSWRSFQRSQFFLRRTIKAYLG